MHMVGAHFSQFRHSLQDIGKMPQLIFEFLRGLIGSPRKDSECCHICKIIFFIKPSEVTAEGFPVGNNLCGHSHIRRYMQVCGEIIRRSCRNIPDRDKGLVPALHHPADHLIQGTVASRADNVQIVVFPFAHDPSCVSGCFRRITDDLEVRAGQDLKDLHQVVFYL